MSKNSASALAFSDVPVVLLPRIAQNTPHSPQAQHRVRWSDGKYEAQPDTALLQFTFSAQKILRSA